MYTPEANLSKAQINDCVITGIIPSYKISKNAASRMAKNPGNEG